jgi:hypothetical protein
VDRRLRRRDHPARLGLRRAPGAGLRPIDGITFNRDGTPRRYQLGTIANNLFSFGGESDGPGENVYFDFPIVAPTERAAAAGHLTWDATPALTLELGFNYGHGEGEFRSVAYRNTALTIQASNPFIPRSADPTLDIPTILAASGATSFTLGKGFADVGPGQVRVTNDVYRAVAAATYDIGGSWKADAYYQFGRNDFRRDLHNGTITARILRAVDAVALPGGAIVCRVNSDASTANDDPACVPLNPFGYAQGATFAAARDYVTEDGFQENRTTEHVIAANVTGTAVELPAGPLGVAIGVEYRSDSIRGRGRCVLGRQGLLQHRRLGDFGQDRSHRGVRRSRSAGSGRHGLRRRAEPERRYPAHPL